MISTSSKSLSVSLISLLMISILFFMDKLWYFKIDLSIGGRQNPFEEIVAILSCLLFGICLAKGNIIKLSYLSYSKVLMFLFFSVVISFIFGSVACFNQPPDRIFRAILWFCGILAYFYLITHKYRNKIADKLFDHLLSYGTIAAFFSIVISLTPDLQSLIDPEVISDRFGLVRYGRIAEDSILICFCYYFIKLVTQIKHQKSTMLFFAISAYSVYFVQMQRQKMLIIPIAILIFAIIGISSRKLAFAKLIKHSFIVIFIILLTYTFFSDESKAFIANVFDSLDTKVDSIDNQSFTIRLEGINYYYNLFKDTHYAGIGYVSTASDMQQNAVTYATNVYNFKLVDLGIIGTLFQYGFVGILVYVNFLYITFKFLVHIYKYGDYNNRLFSLALLMFFTIKILSLNYLFYWPSLSYFYALVIFLIDQRYQIITYNKSLTGNQCV